jgi:hypothetical protein
MMDGKPSERMFSNLIEDDREILLKEADNNIEKLKIEVVRLKQRLKKVEWEVAVLRKQYFKSLNDWK